MERRQSEFLSHIIENITPEERENTRNKMWWAARLDEVMRNNGITANEFAKILNLSEDEFSELLCGNIDFDGDIIEIIKRYL